jgi:hypothetical protein
MKTFYVVLSLLLVQCSFTNTPTKSENQDLRVGPTDWNVITTASPGVRVTTKTVKPEKAELLRRNFRVPSLVPRSVPQAGSFEIYDVAGIENLEQYSYVHPKIFVQTSLDGGAIIAYRTKDNASDSTDLVEVAIPVALIDGTVPAIAIPGAPHSGSKSAISLPEQYRISDTAALETALQKPVRTLPLCPKSFRLLHQGREYYASSPFNNLSTCPVNQFFRVVFKAPASEMRQILDTAATNEESVSIVAELESSFEFPISRIDTEISPQALWNRLRTNLPIATPANDASKGASFPTYYLESAITNALFSLLSEAGLSPRKSAGLPQTISHVMNNYFVQRTDCGSEFTCRTLVNEPPIAHPVLYGWLETEHSATALRTTSSSPLGSVANSSRFTSTSRSLKEVSNSPVNESDQSDYLPLGNNTVVYPGAWLRIDIDEISELTTAKTRTNKDGSISVQSEVIDLLAGTSPDQRTTCVEGDRLACKKYQTKQVPILNKDGSQARHMSPCDKSEDGKNGCACAPGPTGEERCLRSGEYAFQDVLDYSCDAQNETTFCPYWRDEEQLVSYEIEYECKDVKKQSKTNFLCIGGCEDQFELECKERSRKPVKAVRQVLNCIEDEEELHQQLKADGQTPPPKRATARRITQCSRPQYKCAEWSSSCTKYSVNEAFQIVHEEPVSKWRPFSLENGEFPQRFEDDIYLKFVSPSGRVATNCQLSRFPRELRGNTMFIKIPDAKGSSEMCDQPIWDQNNLQQNSLPKVFIKNEISYAERRLCGKTQYSFLTKEIPSQGKASILPSQFSFKTEVNVGPIVETCLAENPERIGNDLWFTEYPPIRFSGRVSVLGKMLDAILAPEVKP